MKELTRRELLSYVTAVGATTFLGMPRSQGPLWPGLSDALAAAPELKEVTVWGVIDAQISTQQITADKNGYFKSQGLTVKNRLVQNGTDIGPLMAGGSAPLNFEAEITVQISSANNVPAFIVAPTANIAGTQAVVVKPSLKITSAKDLEGKTIGMSRGAGVLIAIRSMCKDLGVDINKIKFVNMQPTDQLAALSRGDIDGIAVWEPWVTKAIAGGGVFLFSGKLANLPEKKGPVNWMDMHGTFNAVNPFLKNNPETIKAIIRGLLKATDFVNQNRDEALDLLSPVLHIPKNELRDIMNRNKYSMAVDENFVNGCNMFSSFLHELKVINRPVQLKEYTDFSLLAEVDPSLLKVKI
jgi:ABC-type nitrate/sulfonate/bicarbonate transport system substrate-binding protein